MVLPLPPHLWIQREYFSLIKVHMLRGQSSWANCQSAGVGGVACPDAQMESFSG